MEVAGAQRSPIASPPASPAHGGTMAARVQAAEARTPLLLVKTGGPGRRRLLQSLSAPGNLYIVCMSEERNWADPYVDEWLMDPTTDHEQGIARVQQFMRERGIVFQGVLSYDEYGTELAAHIAAALKLPGIRPENIHVIRNKLALRQLCQRHGVPSPRTLRLNGHGVVVRSEQHLQQMLAEAGMAFPLVVKPTHGAGKYAVRRVDSAAEMFKAIVDFRDNVDAFIKRWVLPRDHAEGLFAETLLQGGPEVDVDFVASRGRLVFMSINENRTAIGPGFAEAGGHCPPTFSAAVYESICQLTKVGGKQAKRKKERRRRRQRRRAGRRDTKKTGARARLKQPEK